MTEMAVRDGVASVMVKDYGQTRVRAWQREFPMTLPVTQDVAAIIRKEIPELAGSLHAGPSPDGPMAIGTVN